MSLFVLFLETLCVTRIWCGFLWCFDLKIEVVVRRPSKTRGGGALFCWRMCLIDRRRHVTLSSICVLTADVWLSASFFGDMFWASSACLSVFLFSNIDTRQLPGHFIRKILNDLKIRTSSTSLEAKYIPRVVRPPIGIRLTLRWSYERDSHLGDRAHNIQCSVVRCGVFCNTQSDWWLPTRTNNPKQKQQMLRINHAHTCTNTDSRMLSARLVKNTRANTTILLTKSPTGTRYHRTWIVAFDF